MKKRDIKFGSKQNGKQDKKAETVQGPSLVDSIFRPAADLFKG